MIDTHSHLFNSQFNDIEECIARCKDNNINKIVLVGFDNETNKLAQEYSKKYSIFYPTAGIHPSEANENYEKDLNDLYSFVKENKIYAIGECGLDYHYGKDNIEYQKLLFKAQIELAIKMDLPVIIHMRDATLDTYNILKEYSGKLRGVMHCYSGSYEMAMEFIKLGLYISLGGPVTFKNSKDSKIVAKQIPIDKLLIETDCPYLAPTPYRGSRNESSYVKYVASEIALLREMTLDEIDEITTRNSEKLFRI
ncbi:MAG: TatD family deoxyribonuclease [Erysipelotrichaceae bacterium]|nr:TatD family deoxyribonuclease [Erysipelotrichaceae bacterium]